MNLDPQRREYLATTLGDYLNQTQQPTWATLWYHPSKLEPEVVRLIAVMDNPKVVKALTREKSEIEAKMKSQSEAGTRLFMEIIPTKEFHLRYQTQSGYELIREWNGDNPNIKKPVQISSWLKNTKATKILIPLLIAALLMFIVRIFAQQGI